MTKTDHPYRTGAEITRGIIVTTSNSVEDSKVDRYLGLVRGIVVRSPTIGQGFMGAIKSIGGGNIEEWADVCESARHDAYQRMLKHAVELGAHAIIAVRYDATEFSQGATEVLVYGTAVTLNPPPL